jgi:hypothetical protein
MAAKLFDVPNVAVGVCNGYFKPNRFFPFEWPTPHPKVYGAILFRKKAGPPVARYAASSTFMFADVISLCPISGVALT